MNYDENNNDRVGSLSHIYGHMEEMLEKNELYAKPLNNSTDSDKSYSFVLGGDVRKSFHLLPDFRQTAIGERPSLSLSMKTGDQEELLGRYNFQKPEEVNGQIKIKPKSNVPNMIEQIRLKMNG